MSKSESLDSSDSPSPGEGDSIRVFVRVRPPAYNEGDSERNYCLSVDQSKHAVVMKAKPDAKIFTFDHVADVNTTQEAVFCAVGKKIIESCVGGYNGTIFAYGQTGSGKTFTMLGPSEGVDNFQHDLRGIIPRSFEYLFNLINREIEMHGEKKTFLCKCSFLEIYHEQIFDLLDPTSTSLHLRENMKTGVYVSDLTEKAVTSAVEAYQVLSAGWLNRRVASTSMNRESSRSHAVFTLQIESKEKKGAIQNVRCSHLNLVDLAGSERQKDTNTVGIRLKEAGSINKSLSTLGNVIMALVTSTNGKTRHVPYRESKLTFLLRDSLGGNAKTQLIACVHPSSKCFGETLSTLQFARRAKLIKNKAVVNEDSLGNTAHLQAEVRRLKELLAQFQNREVPSNPTDGVTQRPDNSSQSSSHSEWKKNFIHAMFFREHSEQEKRNLQDQVSKLEDLSNKKEKFLQSTKMIVKFRENYISKLEKAKKEGSSINEVQNNRVTDLLDEIKELKDQIDNNPETKKYALENQRLKGELRKVRGQEPRCEQVLGDPQRIQQLEAIFRELLLAKKEGAGGQEDMSGVLSTPQTGENNIAIATVEKYKSQVEKLQNEVEHLKEKLQEKENESQRALVNAAAELTSYKKAVSELEKVLQARQLKNRIEREALSDIHVQTIKTITTPTKTCYNLRNRTILSRLSGPSLDLDGSLTLEPGEELLEETQPPQMAEQMAEALTDEIKNLQDNNNSLVQRVEEHEGEMIRLRQALNKLETENEHINQILCKERSDWTKKEEDYVKQAQEVSMELIEKRELARICKEECEDLRVMLQSVDKELATLKDKSNQKMESRDKDISVLETKVLKVETELAQLVTDNAKLTEDKNMLQESFDNAQATISFHESQITDLEDLLNTKREELKKIQNEIESTYSKLMTEKEKNSQLQSQMQSEGKEQKEELLKLMEDLSTAQAQRSNIQNMFDAQSESLSLLSKELDITRATLASQEQQISENKEGMRCMMGKNTELRDGWEAEKEIRLSLEAQVEDASHQVLSLQQITEDQRVKIDNLKTQLNDMASQKEQKINAHNVEMSMLRDELECAMEAYEKLQEELQARQRVLEDTQAESDKAMEELAKVRSKEVLLKEDMERERSEFRQRLEELEEVTEPRGQPDCQELIDLISSQADEIAKYKQNQNHLQQLLDDFEATRQEKNNEIKILKTELSAAMIYKADAETLLARCKESEEELETIRVASQEKQEELETLIESIRSELQSLTKVTEKNAKLSDENDKLQLELAEAQLSADELQEDVDRLQCLAAKDHGDKEELLSQLEVLQAENNQTNKDFRELQERLKSVEDEHARLVGHQNHKQKIQFHLAVKEENHQLREQVLKLTSELAKFKLLRNSADKENAHPQKYTPGTIPSCPKHLTPSKVIGSHMTKVTPTRKTYTTPGKANTQS